MSSKSKNILAYTALAIALLVFASSAYSLLGISHFVGQSFTGWVLVVLAVLGVVVTVKVLKGKQDKRNKKASRRFVLDRQSIVTLIIVLFVAIFVMDSVKIYYKNQAIEDIKSQASTEQEYVETAIKDCADSGQKESLCRCFYSGMLDKYGIDEVYAVDNPNNDTPNPRAEKLLKGCRENG